MKSDETTPTDQPILQDAQSRLLRATLAVYAAERDVDTAAAEVARVADRSQREVIIARFALSTAESKLRKAELKRKAVIARIRRDDAERDGRPWLRVVGTRAA